MNTNQEPIAWCKVNTNIFSFFPLLKFSCKPKKGWNPLYTKKQLDAAFALGVAQEREECAKVAESTIVGKPSLRTSGETHVMDMTAIEAGRAIRARGKE